MRLVFRQNQTDSAQHTVHFGLGFADGQTADGKGRENQTVPNRAAILRANPHTSRLARCRTACVRVFQIFKGFFAPFRPAQAHLQRFFACSRVASPGVHSSSCIAMSEFKTVWIFMEISGDKNSLSPLIGLLNVRRFFRQLAHIRQRKNLKTARVGQNRFVPADKAVKPPNCSTTSKPGRSHK